MKTFMAGMAMMVAVQLIGCSSVEQSLTGESVAGVPPKAAPEEPPAAEPVAVPVSAGVKAGAADDNVSFNSFLEFLEKNIHLGLPCNVSRRIILRVMDRDGLPLPGARIEVRNGSRTLLERRTYADGRALIFASESPEISELSNQVQVTYGDRKDVADLHAAGMHQIDFRLDLQREEYQRVPLDVVFVFDTTGSMGDEIQQLKQTLEVIHFQINHLTPPPDVRFGMVLFRDRGEVPHTEVIPLTGDVKEFTKVLNQVQAGGGGDTPEDVQAALADTLQQVAWREDGVRLAFLIGDAPPHLDYPDQVYTYVNAMRDAAKKGIKIATIGASGLDGMGELVWRQIAQYTLAPFVFLTYGEKGDRAGGAAGGVSHHVGTNWVAENLETIIIRMIKLELSHYSKTGTVPSEDYFVASERSGLPAEDVLQDLFGQSIRQLIGYCLQRIEAGTPTVVVPVKADKESQKIVAEKLEGRLSLQLAKMQEFRLLENRDLETLKKLQLAQFSERYDSKLIVELGHMVPAKLAVFGKIEASEPGKVEMLIKLVRLETGEILSLSLLKIDEGLVAVKK